MRSPLNQYLKLRSLLLIVGGVLYLSGCKGSGGSSVGSGSQTKVDIDYDHVSVRRLNPFPVGTKESCSDYLPDTASLRTSWFGVGSHLSDLASATDPKQRFSVVLSEGYELLLHGTIYQSATFIETDADFETAQILANAGSFASSPDLAASTFPSLVTTGSIALILETHNNLTECCAALARKAIQSTGVSYSLQVEGVGAMKFFGPGQTLGAVYLDQLTFCSLISV